MAKKIALITALLLLVSGISLGEMTVERNEGEAYFPSPENWTYHFTYAYPQLTGEDYASALINDTYQMALDEMLHLVLPMFAHEEEMLYDGKNEVAHDFIITCNNGRFLSILQHRSQTRGEEGLLLTMESQVFDIAGEYQGETLTLRGLVMVGESSAQIGDAVSPILYEEFKKLQAAGICKSELTEDDFLWEFMPTQHFYADEQGNAVFYFPPVLLAEPSFDVPLFPYTPEELQALL